MSEKSFRERLLERGVPERALDEYSDEALQEIIKELGDEEYVARLLKFQDFLENFDKYKRKRVSITLAQPVYELLQYFVKDIRDAEGEPYPFSYFIEDALVWLLRHPEAFGQFLEETYGEEDGSEEEETEGEES